MPYSLVLHCVSTNGAVRPEDLQGQKAMALFLGDLIQTQDAAVAARLHAPDSVKPFTTALMPRPGITGDRRHSAATASPRPSAGAGEPCEVHLRLTLLDDALYPLVSQFFLQNLGSIPKLHLGQSTLVVSRVLATPESRRVLGRVRALCRPPGDGGGADVLDTPLRHAYVVQGR